MNVAINICIQVFVWTYTFISLGHILKSGIAGSCGNSVIVLSRNCQIVFHSGHTIVHSHQQCMRVLISPHPCQHLLLSVLFFTLAILLGVKWCLIVVLICISLLTSDVEHLLCAYWLFAYLWSKRSVRFDFNDLRFQFIIYSLLIVYVDFLWILH